MSKYHQLLGVEPGASQKEISKAYRALALKYHPDRNPNNLEESLERMIQLNNAYDVLNGKQENLPTPEFSRNREPIKDGIDICVEIYCPGTIIDLKARIWDDYKDYSGEDKLRIVLRSMKKYGISYFEDPYLRIQKRQRYSVDSEYEIIQKPVFHPFIDNKIDSIYLEREVPVNESELRSRFAELMRRVFGFRKQTGENNLPVCN